MKRNAITALLAWVLLGQMNNTVFAAVPADFPTVHVTTFVPGAVGEGYIFLAVASVTEGVGTYMMIFDNNGTPVWYEKLNTNQIYDFKVQPNGYLTSAPFIFDHSYTDGGDVYHQIRDDNYNIIEELHGKNGYVAEGHDFQVLPNGNILQFGYYLSEVDVSQIVNGGHPAALVSGGVIQELDADRNVVFQWRTWDHFNFEDRLTSTNAVISDFHLNDIFQDFDGNIVVGTPLEIRKINRQTGDVMWTLGGEENEFTVTNPPDGDLSDFGGHATYRLENGNFLMYDNGTGGGATSSIHEYAVDEVNKEVTHIRSWQPDTSVPSLHGGNAQRLPNGNTLIGWGGALGSANVPAVTEVTPTGDVVFEMYFDSAPNRTPIESYRAFRFPYPPATQAIEHSEEGLATGNTIPFGATGLTIEVNSGGGGYNLCTVRRQPYAPVDPLFMSKAPRVLPMRVSITELSIGSINASIDFDNTSFGFANPDDLTVYYRPITGEGLFLPQETANTGSALRVTLDLFSEGGDYGEFIFGYDDVADVAYPPILNRAENYRGVQDYEVIAPRKAEPGVVYQVNQNLDILLSFSPKGLARSYFIQVATNPSFTNPVVNQMWLGECRYIWSGALDNTTYYWRARIYNEAGDSNWSTGTFRTVPPMIEVTAPVENEALKTGWDYFVKWNDNIQEDVTIELYKGGVFVTQIGTVPSDRAYEWFIDPALNLAPGCDYTIKITSSTNGTLYDESDTFKIDPIDGDFDCNGCVKFDDYVTLASQWSLVQTGLEADLDGDGDVALSDLLIFAGNWIAGECP